MCKPYKMRGTKRWKHTELQDLYEFENLQKRLDFYESESKK
jgi:hypothetical protein